MKLSDNLVSPKTNSKTLCVASSKKAPTNVGEKEYRGVKVNIKETTFLTTKLQLRSEKKIVLLTTKEHNSYSIFAVLLSFSFWSSSFCCFLTLFHIS